MTSGLPRGWCCKIGRHGRTQGRHHHHAKNGKEEDGSGKKVRQRQHDSIASTAPGVEQRSRVSGSDGAGRMPPAGPFAM